MFAFVGLLGANVRGAEPASQEFLEFIRQQARDLSATRIAETPAGTKAEWALQEKGIRGGLASAWGAWPGPAPAAKASVEVRKLGELDRDGYRLERLLLQTLPGVWMTAHAYVPKTEGKPAGGKCPAILQVHGHWAGAKQDPHVQARCIGAVKHGFFVLAVDAFGAGERGVTNRLGEYHGEMVAATLYPLGTPLSGLQVYENMRAVDYLQSRPEVDGSKIGITGASGGGNQTMYAGAWDTRFGAAVPVCSVGNYQSYLGQACCMCEVVPGALRFTEEWGILGLTAPRGLMVVSATRDAVQFSVGEAKKSLVLTEKVYALEGTGEKLRHAVFESPHDYSPAMREAMYGWMKLHLAGEGDGSPLADPPMTLEDPEAIRCYPGDTRPADWVTLPQYAAREGTRLLEQVRLKSDRAGLEARRAAFRSLSLALPPSPARSLLGDSGESGQRTLNFLSEPGISLTARIAPADAAERPTVILLDLAGADAAGSDELAKAITAAGCRLVNSDLRATGKLALPRDSVGRAPDHNSAEWSLWIGRPLLGQWVQDLRQLLKSLRDHDAKLVSDVTIVGVGPAGLVPLAWSVSEDAEAFPGVRSIAAVGTMASYIHPAPYEGQRLGTMLPGLLRDVGDIADIAGLGRHPLLLANMTDGGNKALTAEQADATFGPARMIRKTLDQPAAISVMTGVSVGDLVAAIQAAKRKE